MHADRIVISGSSGLIGTALAASLRTDGFEVTRLVRRSANQPDEVEWHPERQPLDPAVLAGSKAVVNLGGASIGHLPWTPKYRRTLISSRLQPTRTLAEAIRLVGAEAPHFVSASAVGFYGDRPGEQLTELSGPGETYLARLCREWERAALDAGDHARVALLRTAPLLHPQAVLKPLVTLTRLGLSGPLGGGRQVWPWISLADEVGAIKHVIAHGITGPVNLTGPETASANDIGRELARQLRRPYAIPAPKPALRLALGRDAADSLLLADASVLPETLGDSGYAFIHPTVALAIASELDR